MTSLSWTNCSTPPYSQDVAPCDFALLQHLKQWLRGTHFENLSYFVMMFLLQYPTNGMWTCSGSGWIGISAVWSSRDVTLIEVWLVNIRSVKSECVTRRYYRAATILNCLILNFDMRGHCLRWKCNEKIYLFVTFLNRSFTIYVHTRAQVDDSNDTLYVFFDTSNYI